jgi:pimeloyl-ACP methyl ester carboxylesterase
LNIITGSFLVLVGILAILAGLTRYGVAVIERRHPPVGSFAYAGGADLHFVHLKPKQEADLPPLVFIHGASGNLLDPMVPFRPPLENRAELLFFDRPGHGWSERSPTNGSIAGQADALAALMDRLGIARAVIVAHSFGGTLAATFALRHPRKTVGTLFLSAATHPWPGRAIAWHYRVTAMPVLGRLFSETLALPAGWLRLNAATVCVFAPNKVPDSYLRDTGIALVLRPNAFRNNAHDVASLYEHNAALAPRYGQMQPPAIIISGDSDTVVAEEIHSVGLARDIPRAELVWVKNLGHKPDYVATELAIAAMEKLAGTDRDLQAMARALETRIDGDRFGPVELCGAERLAPLPGEDEMKALQMPLKPSEPI